MRLLHFGMGIGVLAVVVAGCDDGGGVSESTPEVAVTNELPTCDADNGGLTLPDGFCGIIFHEGVGSARHLTVAPNGDVYVAIAPSSGGSSSDGGIVALRDTDSDGRADQVEAFGELHGTGIEVVNDYLYFSTDTSVVRYPMPTDGGLVSPGPAELIVGGFPVQRAHAAKSIAFDESGTNLWVDVGAPSNACGGETDRQPGATGLDPCPLLERQGGVWHFDATVLNQDQLDGERWAYGIRNGVAMAVNPGDGDVWLVQHGRDQLDTVSDAFTAEDNATRPGEELLHLTQGTQYSWPYCFWDLQTDRHVLNPEYGGTGEEVGRCADFPDPVATFGGHWAPNDLLFYTGDQFPDRYRQGAFIAFHGSWNRAPLPQQGYRVVFQPLSGGQAAGESETFANGFAGSDQIPSVGDAEHRPVGLAEGPDGSLYISDSVDGTIWRIIYTGD